MTNKDEDETLLEKLIDWVTFFYAVALIAFISMCVILPMITVELVLKLITRSIRWYHRITSAFANRFLFPRLTWARGILIGKDEYGRKTSSRFNRNI